MFHAANKELSPLKPAYQRHRPEQTLLYQLIEQHYPKFKFLMAEQDKSLPLYIQKEFEAYLKCGRLEHGFLRVQCCECRYEHLVAFSCKKRGFCTSCGARRMAESAALLIDEVFPEQPLRQWVLSFPFQLRFLFASRPELMSRVPGIVCRAISSHLNKKAGFTRKNAQTGAVTLIQRFGSALNLNVHFHMLFLDGVYTENKSGKLQFHRTVAPSQEELAVLLHTLVHRIARFLEREGILERDEENSYLNLEGDEDAMQQVLGCSVTYRIAVGSQEGCKVFTLQTLPPREEDKCFARLAKESGFSLHAGVVAQAWEREKLERLCRYISRPAISEKRLSLTPSGNIRYQLKTPYNDGTTHVIFEPLDFISKLVALIPKPRVNLTRFHGVFAPNSPYRSEVTRAKRGKCRSQQQNSDQTPEEKHKAMTWAQRLKRVFNIDVSICPECGSKTRIIACIEEQAIIDKILKHLQAKGVFSPIIMLLPETRASPGSVFLSSVI